MAVSAMPSRRFCARDFWAAMAFMTAAPSSVLAEDLNASNLAPATECTVMQVTLASDQLTSPRLRGEVGSHQGCDPGEGESPRVQLWKQPLTPTLSERALLVSPP